MRIASIVWAESSRIAETLALRLGAEFHLIRTERKTGFARLTQYADLARTTRTILAQSDPDVVLVQNPPIHAVAAVARHCRERRAALVIDAHTGAFQADAWLARHYRQRFVRLAQDALVTLVHNEGLVPLATELGIRHAVLEMAVPEPAPVEPEQVRHPSVAVVCGYGRDEPLSAVLGAIRALPDITFYLTGDSPGTVSRARNLVFAGFRTEPDYWRLLKGCDVVAAFTTRESTILSGAYEGLAAAKPLVLSRTATLEQSFPRGAVLVENRSDAIAAGFSQALARTAELVAQGQVLVEAKQRSWERQFRALQRILDEVRPRA